MFTTIFDCQGFKTTSNVFIVKEIAFSLLCNKSVVSTGHYVIHYATPFKELDTTTAAWLTKNHHQLDIHSVGVPLEYALQALNSIIPAQTLVLVKGVEKVLWVKNLLPSYTIINLEERGCPSLHGLRMINGISKSQATSAKLNVDLLRKWWIDSSMSEERSHLQ